MSKKIALFVVVLVGLIGAVIWQMNVLGNSPEARFARAMKLMEGLQSRAIPVALSESEIDLLEGVYQDSLVRLPNIKSFRETDKRNLISLLSTSTFAGNGPNGLNTIGEKIIIMTTVRVDEFNIYLSTQFENDLGTTATKPAIKKLSQSINTLTNDIRLTTLFIDWYENIRGNLCTTNDPNNDIYISGELRFRYNNNRPNLPDVCSSDNTQLKQHKCILGQYKNEESYVVKTSCPFGCSSGACLKQNQGGLIVNFPGTVTVGENTPIKISVLDHNGQVDMNYTGVFFIIIGGDDEAVFPTGALNIMSGEASRMNTIKFSKEGSMTVTVRTTNGLEITKNVQAKNYGSVNNDYIIAANKLAQLNIIQPQSNVDNYKLLEPVTHQELSLILSYIFKNNISTSTSACENLTKTNKTGKMTEYETLIGVLCAGGLWPEYTILTSSQVINLAHRYRIVESITGVNPNAEVVRGKFFVYLTKALDANKVPNICDIAPDLCPPTCPQLSPPPADFCKDGTVVDGGKNEQGCQLPPTCVASTPAPITIACTGTLPANSVVLLGVGTTPRTWTYDSSPTGPYQNCTFKCATGRNFVSGACI